VDKLTHVHELASLELSRLSAFASRIAVAGSIRRQAPAPEDIDIVVAPNSARDKEIILDYVHRYPPGKRGRGNWVASYIKDGVDIQIYFTTADEFGAMLLYATGSVNYGIGLRVVAKKLGYKLNHHGLLDLKNDCKIASATEQAIYRKLGHIWRPPEQR
jgi:DNA polymerase (family 10)